MINMLSRIADSLFWLNRYMERTDSLVRLMSIHYILSLDKGVNAPQSWQPVLQIATYLNKDEIQKIEHDMPAVLHKIIFDTQNQNSLKVVVHRARENARGAQDHITKETWEEVNQIYHYINQPHLINKLSSNEALEVLEHLAQHAVLFAGIIELTMPRGAGWNFMSLGKYIERCFHTIHVLQDTLAAIDYDIKQQHDILQWRYLLLSLSGYELHLKTYTNNDYNQNLLHQIIWNENFTRSILYSLSRINIYLKKVMAKADDNKESQLLINSLGRLYSMVKYKEPESLTGRHLQQFLNDIQNELSLFSTQLAQQFFSYH